MGTGSVFFQYAAGNWRLKIIEFDSDVKYDELTER